MSSDDPLKDLLEQDSSHQGSEEVKNRERAQAITKKARQRQSQGDFVEFGFIKLWMILLEFLARLHVSMRSGADLNESLEKPKAGDKKDEL